MFRHSPPALIRWYVRFAIPLLTSAMLVVFGSLLFSLPLQAAENELRPEVGGSGKALLDFISTAREDALRKAPGLKPEVVAKIMSHRAGGGKFRNLLELNKVTGISSLDLEAALAPYRHIDEGLAREASRAPVQEVSPSSQGSKAAGRSQIKETPADPAAAANRATPAGPIGAVRPGYYAKLPGYEDLDKIDTPARTEFLERINAEQCPCGCQGETLAFCLVNDPGCAVVKGRVRKIYEDITRKPSQ